MDALICQSLRFSQKLCCMLPLEFFFKLVIKSQLPVITLEFKKKEQPILDDDDDDDDGDDKSKFAINPKFPYSETLNACNFFTIDFVEISTNVSEIIDFSKIFWIWCTK